MTGGAARHDEQRQPDQAPDDRAPTPRPTPERAARPSYRPPLPNLCKNENSFC